MAILFKKPKKFQTGGPMDKLSPYWAQELGVTYTGKHPRAKGTQFSTLQTEGVQDFTNYQVTNPQGQVVSGNRIYRPSANAVVGRKYFDPSAAKLASMTGGAPLTRTASFGPTKEFTQHWAANKSLEGMPEDFVVGNLTDIPSKSYEKKTAYPITVADMSKYGQYIGDVVSNPDAWKAFSSYFQ